MKRNFSRILLATVVATLCLVVGGPPASLHASSASKARVNACAYKSGIRKVELNTNKLISNSPNLDSNGVKSYVEIHLIHPVAAVFTLYGKPRGNHAVINTLMDSWADVEIGVQARDDQGDSDSYNLFIASAWKNLNASWTALKAVKCP